LIKFTVGADYLKSAKARPQAAAGEFTDEELYPSDAQWAGIFDQLDNPTEEEIERRRLISGNA